MEIKVQCNCGTRYKFDVEPVNGHAPTELACPSCGASWTDYTNAVIAQTLAASAPAPGPAVAPVSIAAAPPVAPAPSPPTGARLSLRVAMPAPAPSATAPAEAAAPATDAEAAVPAASSARPVTRVVTLDPLPEQAKGNFGLGLLGAAVGALVGTLIYYAVFHNPEGRADGLKLMAVGVGLLTGLGAKLLAKEGCSELGLIAATLSIAGVTGAQYFVARSWWQAASEIKPAILSSAYEAEVKEAREVIAAIPNGTEKEIRAYLAKEASREDGKPVDPANVDSAAVGDFRDTTLPHYRDLANGKTTKEDYERKITGGAEGRDLKQEKEAEERTFKWVFMALTLSRFNIACLVGAAGLAYKVSS